MAEFAEFLLEISKLSQQWYHEEVMRQFTALIQYPEEMAVQQQQRLWEYMVAYAEADAGDQVYYFEAGRPHTIPATWNVPEQTIIATETAVHIGPNDPELGTGKLLIFYDPMESYWRTYDQQGFTVTHIEDTLPGGPGVHGIDALEQIQGYLLEWTIWFSISAAFASWGVSNVVGQIEASAARQIAAMSFERIAITSGLPEVSSQLAAGTGIEGSTLPGINVAAQRTIDPLTGQFTGATNQSSFTWAMQQSGSSQQIWNAVTRATSMTTPWF